MQHTETARAGLGGGAATNGAGARVAQASCAGESAVRLATRVGVMRLPEMGISGTFLPATTPPTK